jgi:hypothetical protein
MKKMHYKAQQLANHRREGLTIIQGSNTFIKQTLKTPLVLQPGVPFHSYVILDDRVAPLILNFGYEFDRSDELSKMATQRVRRGSVISKGSHSTTENKEPIIRVKVFISTTKERPHEKDCEFEKSTPAKFAHGNDKDQNFKLFYDKKGLERKGKISDDFKHQEIFSIKNLYITFLSEEDCRVRVTASAKFPLEKKFFFIQ